MTVTVTVTVTVTTATVEQGTPGPELWAKPPGGECRAGQREGRATPVEPTYQRP
ncbi:hypothetical protein [Streptomyces sp. NPDC058698]|uniref:hypothetical protein n=1 Tax=Streptomyces sp. NPDC058698 TaxID=3346606 RepID=UPI00364C1C18